jgi:chromosome segregation ATPase
MVEPMMYFGIGFLVAALFGLIFIPLVHSRAVRLTMRRLEASTPLSMAEIQADKDQLRAEFAMSTRRLEMSVDQMKAKTTSQLAELGKKSDAINRLKRELGEKSATINVIEAREKSLKEQIRATEEEIGVKTNLMHDAERQLNDKEAELGKLTGALSERATFADGQTVEIVALRTQTHTLKDQLRDHARDLRDMDDRLTRERKDAQDAGNELTAERTKVGSLAGRVADLERALIAQQTEAELMGRRAQDLETRLSEQGRMLAERDYQIEQLRGQHETLQKTETDLRTQIATIAGRFKNENETLKADRASAEEQLDRAREERAKLHKEISAMKRDAESSWAEERVENALLRERINDVAAEVSRLTMVLEGPGSAIETILAEDAAHAASANANGALNGNGLKTVLAPSHGMAQGVSLGEGGKGTLADRIRALQLRASAVSAPN